MLAPHVQLWIHHYGSVALAPLLALGIVGLPVPDETLLAFAGDLIFRGELLAVPTFFFALVGSSVGISLSYAIGRFSGSYLTGVLSRFLHLTPARLNRAERWFERGGKWSLTFGYFLPGVRHLVALVAGTARLPLPTFAAYAYGGAAIWCATFLTLGYYWGERWAHWSGRVHRIIVIAAVATVVVVASALVVRALLRRGRMSPRTRS